MAASQTDILLAEEANFHLIGLFLLLLLSGFYIHIFIDCISVMLRRRSAHDVQPWWLVAATVFLFLDLILDIIMCMIGDYSGLRIDPNAVAAGAARQPYISDQSSPIAVIPDVCLVVGILLTDAIMVYRTYVVWDRRLIVIIVPCLLWVANTATVLWAVVGIVSTPETSAVVIYLAAVLTRVTVTGALSFALNVLCAGLITLKILRDSSGDGDLTVTLRFQRRLNKIVEIIIQSAGIWCLALLAFIVTAALHTPVFFIILDCMMPIQTIVFSLIIIRLWNQSASPRLGAPGRSSGIVSDMRFGGGIGSNISASRPGMTPHATTVEIAIETLERTGSRSGSDDQLSGSGGNDTRLASEKMV